MYKFSVKKFSNGLRLLLVPSRESLSFRATVYVRTGANFETKKNNGISHLLEHMCFKGTAKRPSNLAITQELDAVGGSYNAFTGREVTGYYTYVARKNAELAVDIVSDIFLNSLFPSPALQKEKRVVREEIHTYKDIPQSYIFELWDKLVYGDQPSGWPIVGTVSNVLSFSREDLLRYYKRQYRAQSTLVTISGNFSSASVISLIKRYFANIRKGKASPRKPVRVSQKKPRLLLYSKKTDQTHLLLGVRGIKYSDKRRYALDVLEAIFDGGMSGRLFQLIREKLSAAYWTKSYIDYYPDYGEWRVYAGVDNCKTEMVISGILQEWQKFKNYKVSPAELRKAQNYLTGKVALSLENVHSVASKIAAQLLLYNKVEMPKDYLRKIRQVTVRDIQKVAQDLLTPERLNLVVISSSGDKRKLRKLLKI
ncbi:insulinase family protein [bacterium]|nr:insulinase family protein [bacterium]